VAAAGGEHPFADLVRERGGLAVAEPADVPAPLGDAAFVAVLARGEAIQPPVARLSPWQAAAWLLLASDDELDDEEAASAQGLAEALAEAEAPAYLVTAGRVGGGEESLSHEIPAELVERVLGAASAGEIDWEADPDFGYELPMEVPGLDAEARRILVPRFLYACTDRVYDYAAMVPVVQGERHARLVGVVGLATAVVGAVAPPKRRGG
jgi:phosphoenolpyruvate carboxykinase (ATP)